MHIFMTGGTGFIGRHLSKMLISEGFNVTIATRNPDKYQASGNDGPSRESDQRPALRYVLLQDDHRTEINQSDVVINLAGESLFGKWWTARVKKRLYDSRIQTTRSLVSDIKEVENKPDLFISASAVGYYGDRGDQIITEDQDSGNDFLATVCRDWEKEAQAASKLGTRVVNPRIGIALGTDGGALSTMLPVFRKGLGGAIGSGSQFFPWIHVDDLCRSILYAIQEKSITGPFNATAPNPVSMDVFSRELAHALSRPSFFKVPEVVLKSVLGEAATMLTASLRAVPEKLEKHGFCHNYPNLSDAFGDLLQS